MMQNFSGCFMADFSIRVQWCALKNSENNQTLLAFLRLENNDQFYRLLAYAWCLEFQLNCIDSTITKVHTFMKQHIRTYFVFLIILNRE